MILLKRPAFFRDLDHYSSRIAVDNPGAARRFVVAAEATCEQLRKHPEIGHQENFRKLRGIRSWRVDGFGSYLVFYRFDGTTVEVLRLLHGALDLPGLFR